MKRPDLEDWIANGDSPSERALARYASTLEQKLDTLREQVVSLLNSIPGDPQGIGHRSEKYAYETVLVRIDALKGTA